MANSVIIAPSILAADHARLADEISAVVDGGADWIHLDVMDGSFVPNLTMGPPVIRSLRRSAPDVPFDVHLMIENPQLSIEQYVEAGADWLTVHAEACPHLDRVLHQIRDAGAHPGVSLNPSTPLCQIEHVVDLVDLVLIMTVNPGFGGQHFIPQMLSKIRATHDLIAERNPAAHLEVDGGIDSATVGPAAQSGANVFVAGSAVFNSASYAQTISQLRSLAAGQRP